MLQEGSNGLLSPYRDTKVNQSAGTYEGSAVRTSLVASWPRVQIRHGRFNKKRLTESERRERQARRDSRKDSQQIRSEGSSEQAMGMTTQAAPPDVELQARRFLSKIIVDSGDRLQPKDIGVTSSKQGNDPCPEAAAPDAADLFFTHTLVQVAEDSSLLA